MQRILASLLCVVLGDGAIQGAETAGLDTAAIEIATGLKGTLNAEEAVFKVAVPRTDVKIAVDGAALPRSWVSRAGRRSRLIPLVARCSWATWSCLRTR